MPMRFNVNEGNFDIELVLDVALLVSAVAAVVAVVGAADVSVLVSVFTTDDTLDAADDDATPGVVRTTSRQ